VISLRLLVGWSALLFSLAMTAGAQTNSVSTATSSPASAQAHPSSLNGTVTDPAGKPVASAAVVLSWKTGEKAATSNAKGEYEFTGLNPGDYKLKVTAPGLDPFETDVTLPPDLALEIDAPMQPPPGATQTGLAPVLAPADGPVHPKEPSPTPAPQAQGPKIPGASLNGSVTDPSGAVIPQATVTIDGPGGEKTGTSNDHGDYLVQGLAPGAYKLKVSAKGFADFTTDVTLAADQGLEIDASLQPPSATTNITVEGQTGNHVETESAHIEGTITQKEVVNAPLNGRNFTQLIALTPGVSNQTGQDEAKVGVAGSVKYSVNGGRVEYNNFDVDGSDVLNAGLNGAESTLMVYPSLDAIQEVKVLTSNYGAMYGRTASGTVLVTTKSGTGQFHGNAYEFLRNEFFNARNYFDQTTKAPLYRRQDFGGTLGGPLYIPGVFDKKKDNTYFFVSEEFRLEKSPQGPGGEGGDFNQAVPTMAQRSGIFNDVCPPVSPGGQATFLRAQYPDCPAASSSGVTLSTFPGNQIPIDTNSALLFNSGLIPAPNSSTGCNSTLANVIDPTGAQLVPCYDAVISPETYWREELFRIDHDFTQSVKVSFRYIHDAWDTTVVTPQWGFVHNSFPTVQNRLTGPGTSLVARFTDTISPTLLNELVLSYVNAHITLNDRPGLGANLQRPSGLQMGYIFNNGFGNKLPGIVIGGTNGAYGGDGFTLDTSYMPWVHTNPTYSLSDNISKALGRHTLQFGVQIVDAQRSEINGAIGAATGDIQGLLTFSNENNALSTGNAFADFLIQQSGSLVNPIQSYQQDSAQRKYYNNYWIYEPYAQDDWRMTRRLTLNVGLRMSLFGNFHEKNLNAWNWDAGAFDRTLAATVKIDQSSGFQSGYLETTKGVPILLDPNNPSNNLNPAVTNGLVQCGKNGIPASCMTSHYFNPSPRVGFAWDPKGDGKTSIRGGYGIFFEHGTAKEANTGSLEGSSPLVLTMTNFFPLHYNTIGQDPSGDQVAFPLDVTSIPKTTVWPYVQQWSLSVQHQISSDTVATIAYVGSKGTHLSAELQLNQLTPLTTAPDTGIFLNGNPFGQHEPINTATCNSYNGSSFTIHAVDTGVLEGIVTPDQPAWINMLAACYGVNPGIPNPNTLRTYAPGFQRILALQNIADSQYHALQATMRRAKGPLTVGVSYTYSHSLDDSSDRSDATFVNSANIQSNRASSNYDQRHLLNISYVYNVPKLSGMFDSWVRRGPDTPEENAPPRPAQSDSHVMHTLLDGWQISGITLFASGTPFSVLNGGSNNGISVLDNAGVANGAGVGSFPDVIGNPRAAKPPFNDAQSVGPLLYNPAAFAAPRGLTFGDAGRNFLTNPHRWNFDFTLQKNFKITEGSNLEFRAEAFNAFNHTQFRIFNPNIGNTANNTINCYGGPGNSAAGGPTNFGSGNIVNVDCLTGSSFLHPIDAHRPRTMQLGLKYSF
jgi:hypothetical protein